MPNRIAELRKQRGLTLVQLAKQIGVSDGTVSRYETGLREPKLATWILLAEALNTSVPYLQGLSEENQSTNIFGSPDDFGRDEINRSIQYLGNHSPLPHPLNLTLAALINLVLEVSDLKNSELNSLISATMDNVNNYIHGVSNDTADDISVSVDILNEELKKAFSAK
jgi:transcriptional regulator with XRE-family HTH domain